MKDPVSFNQLRKQYHSIQQEYLNLLLACLRTGGLIAGKLCLNTDNTRPWKGAIALSRFMSVKKEHYGIDTITQPGKTSEAQGRHQLHYFRLCREYLDKAVIRCNTDILANDLLLVMEKEARQNQFVTAFILVVLDFQSQDYVSHVSYHNIDLFSSLFPGILIGGLTTDRIREEHKRLFPDQERRDGE